MGRIWLRRVVLVLCWSGLALCLAAFVFALAYEMEGFGLRLRVQALLSLAWVCVVGFGAAHLVIERRLRVRYLVLVVIQGIIVITGLAEALWVGAVLVVLPAAAAGATYAVHHARVRRGHRRGRRVGEARLRAKTVQGAPPAQATGAHPIPQHPALAWGTADEASFVVSLVAARTDFELLGPLAEGIERVSIEAVETVAEGDVIDAVVLVITPAATADPGWLRAAEWWGEQSFRLIPIRVGQIDAMAVPEALREVNWISWTGSEEELSTCVASIYGALHSDLVQHRLLRGLAAEAHAWEQASRPTALLIQDEHRAREQARLLTLAPAPQFDPATAAFVVQSNARALRRRRNRRWRRIGIAMLIASVLSGAVGAVVSLRETVGAQRLVLPVANRALEQAAPDIHAIQAAAVLLQGPDYARDVARLEARDAFAQPWPFTEFAEGIGWRLNDAKLIARGTRGIVADAGFGLSSWSLPSGQPEWRRELAAPDWAVDATPNGSVIVTAGPGNVQIVRGANGPVTRIPIASLALPQGIALTSDGKLAAISNDEKQLFLVDIVRARVTADRTYAGVLDVRAARPGAVSALVVTAAHRIELIDARSGSVERSVPVQGAAHGTLSPDGRSFAFADERNEVYYVEPGRPPRALGVRIAESVWDMAISSDGILLVANAAAASRYIRLSDGIELRIACSGLDGRVKVSIVDGFAVCVDAQRAVVEELPSQPGATIPRPAPTGEVTAEGAGFVVVSGANGSVLVHARSGRLVARMDHVVQGAVTALAVVDDTPSIIVGSSAGEVAELGFLNSDGSGAIAWRWTVPDGSAVVQLDGDASSSVRVVTTANGNRWLATACAVCAHTDHAIFVNVIGRLHRCLPHINLVPISSGARRVLELTECKRPLGATG